MDLTLCMSIELVGLLTVVVVVCAALLVGFCFCCYRCCCRKRVETPEQPGYGTSQSSIGRQRGRSGGMSMGGPIPGMDLPGMGGGGGGGQMGMGDMISGLGGAVSSSFAAADRFLPDNSRAIPVYALLLFIPLISSSTQSTTSNYLQGIEKFR